MEDIKEKTADEMFKELGYEKYDNHPEADWWKLCRVLQMVM